MCCNVCHMTCLTCLSNKITVRKQQQHGGLVSGLACSFICDWWKNGRMTSVDDDEWLDQWKWRWKAERERKINTHTNKAQGLNTTKNRKVNVLMCFSDGGSGTQKTRSRLWKTWSDYCQILELSMQNLNELYLPLRQVITDLISISISVSVSERENKQKEKMLIYFWKYSLLPW